MREMDDTGFAVQRKRPNDDVLPSSTKGHSAEESMDSFAVQRKRPKIEKRFKITPKEIRLLRYWSKSEKISQSRFIEQAIEEFLKSIKL